MAIDNERFQLAPIGIHRLLKNAKNAQWWHRAYVSDNGNLGLQEKFET